MKTLIAITWFSRRGIWFMFLQKMKTYIKSTGTTKKNIAERAYIMRSSTETKCYFLPASVASLISHYDANTKKGEFESTNKSERTTTGSQLIKENFIKLKVDRLRKHKTFKQ